MRPMVQCREILFCFLLPILIQLDERGGTCKIFSKGNKHADEILTSAVWCSYSCLSMCMCDYYVFHCTIPFFKHPMFQFNIKKSAHGRTPPFIDGEVLAAREVSE